MLTQLCFPQIVSWQEAVLEHRFNFYRVVEKFTETSVGGQRHVEVQERLEDDPIDSYDLTAKVLKDIWIPLMNFLKNILVIVLLVWTILACN